MSQQASLNFHNMLVDAVKLQRYYARYSNPTTGTSLPQPETTLLLPAVSPPPPVLTG